MESQNPHDWQKFHVEPSDDLTMFYLPFQVAQHINGIGDLGLIAVDKAVKRGLWLGERWLTFFNVDDCVILIIASYHVLDGTTDSMMPGRKIVTKGSDKSSQLRKLRHALFCRIEAESVCLLSYT